MTDKESVERELGRQEGYQQALLAVLDRVVGLPTLYERIAAVRELEDSQWTGA